MRMRSVFKETITGGLGERGVPEEVLRAGVVRQQS